ncbi:MAG: hypothetical protein PHE56_01760 [Bacteroidales bacterium]|nr:hypothetical protein [Bacteroidales bacterium]
MKTNLFTLIFSCIATISMAQVNEQDSLALVALYNSTDGPNWDCGCNNGWLTEPVEQWYGISVLDGRVTGIDLSFGIVSCGSCGLNGTIPDEIVNLQYLKNVNFSFNDLLGGSLPISFYQLSNLEYIDLSFCNFLGEISGEIENLISLKTVDIRNNNFNGILPNELFNMSTIIGLNISHNNFTGLIPTNISNLENLQSLEISSNNFYGSLPYELGELTLLYKLNASNNNFVGEIPASFGNLINLLNLEMSENQLVVFDDNILNNINTIQIISLNNNQFESIPDLSNLENLVRVKIENNKLTFEDLETNQSLVTIDEYTYSPQDSINSEIDTTVIVNSSITLETICGGENNQYQWYFNNNPIEGATESTYTLTNVIEANQGVYTCAITNTIVTGLTLWRKPITLHVNTSGIEDTNNESIIIEKSGGNLLITNLHDNCNINVYTVEGRLLHSFVCEKDGTATIGISKFPKGVLILKIGNEKNTFISKKIINY